jgi:hypothetical protein
MRIAITGEESSSESSEYEKIPKSKTLSADVTAKVKNFIPDFR